MVMRPYQITATERIINRIEIANNYKNMVLLKVADTFGTPQVPVRH